MDWIFLLANSEGEMKSMLLRKSPAAIPRSVGLYGKYTGALTGEL
jgi:hypothetical protein